MREPFKSMIVKGLKRLAEKIETGYYNELTDDQYDKLRSATLLYLEVEIELEQQRHGTTKN